MTASLKFYSDKGTTETTDPSQTKHVCYTDNNSNKYSIDFSSDKFKLGYQPSGGSVTENEIGLTTVDTSNFVKTDGIGLDKIFVNKLLEVKDGNDNALEKSLSNTFLKKEVTEADVTNLLNKITTADHKPITASELPTKIVDNTVTTALSNTFLKKDASNFDDNKQTDFLTKLGANNGNQLIEKIAEKVVSSNSDNTRAALMSVIENHNEEELVPSYDTLW